MKAIRIHRTGPVEQMQLETIDEPTAQAGELVVRIEAAGVNFIDVYQRTGLYAVSLPYTLGLEGAGVVTQVGAGVTDFQVGDRVVSATVAGAYAEYARVSAPKAVPLPQETSSKLACAVFLQGLTAHYLATSTYPLGKSDTCLVHAGAGGVGLLLCQIARARGARVIATVSSDEKAALAKGAGATDIIQYTKRDFEAEVKQLTDGRGVQVVYDSVGLDTWEQSLKCLTPRGMLVLYGQSSGSVPPIEPQRLAHQGSVFLTRATLAHYTATREELLARSNDLFGWMQAGSLEVRIGLELPLAEAAEAHRRLESRETTGKVLLLP